MGSTEAASWGVVPYAALEPHMTKGQKEWARRLVPNPGSVIAATFPYFAGYGEGTMALYARGEDYHTVVKDRLQRAADRLAAHYRGQFLPLVDASPLPEKTAAALAGLGVIGQTTLLITPENGSFVFIGCILTDAALDGRARPILHCSGCGRCAAACPTGALSVKEGVPALDRTRCLSALTQKKGALSLEETALLKKGRYAWGCDVCQSACPENQGIPLTKIGEFLPKAGYESFFSDLSALTEAQFAQKYGNKAFAWRGKAVIQRNMEILYLSDRS